MRVGLISGEYPPLRGGVADYTANLKEALEQLGIEAGVITSARAGPRQDGVHPVIKGWGVSSWPAVARALVAMGAQVAHVQYQAAAYGMSAAIHLLPWWLRRRCAVVTTFHDLRAPYLFPKAGPLRLWALKSLARGSDAVIVSNDEDWAEVSRWGPKVVRLIPIASNLPPSLPADYDRQAWRARLGVGADDPLLGYFGLLNQSKGVDTLLGAFRRLRELRPSARLLLIGDEVGASDPTNAAYRERVLGLMARWGLDSAVTRTGYLPPGEASAHLAACDVIALPFSDGASLRRGSLMAVLAHGLPLVTTRPTRPCPLKDSEHCLLVARGDEQALAEAVERLLDSPSMRQRLACGAAALSKAFSWPAIAAETGRLYGDLLEGRS